MKSQTAVNHCLPRINAWTVGPVVIGLETLTGQQFGVRNEEVQLQTSFVAVLHPQNAVLVFIKSGHQNPFKAGHQFFTLPGR
ncbi:hypothetical protein EN46_24985 [Citrobacter amalonaticus]